MIRQQMIRRPAARRRDTNRTHVGVADSLSRSSTRDKSSTKARRRNWAKTSPLLNRYLGVSL
ncbi:hypothetical protein HSB1_44230 [Halogranum salarium B-1]|uniref:Uncharacterized protein n=1 Tax=Halogranum salarium B-1 TaxID=1210908 RepID=J3ESS3_9EURY|nr:hypothetical protein HSB1_44230 [Halogranum salarium B-1]